MNWFFSRCSRKGTPLSISVSKAMTRGLGVALESAVNAGPHLATGRLKPVFGLDKAVQVKAHFVVYPAKHAKRPAVEAFLTWVHAEAARTQVVVR